MKQLKDLPAKKKRFIYSLLFPAFFLLILWLVWFVETELNLDFSTWGIFPRRISGLRGIIFAPFIHANIRHLANNSLPLFFLMTGTLYFYREVGYKVFFYLWLIGGVLVWIGARDAYHIGASGIIYGLAAFLFFSGIIRNHIPLIAISLLVVFLYGSMIWGVFPLVEKMSWESHLMGALTGVALAFVYRHEGPQKPPPFWENEEEETEEKYDFTEFLS